MIVVCLFFSHVRAAGTFANYIMPSNVSLKVLPLKITDKKNFANERYQFTFLAHVIMGYLQDWYTRQKRSACLSHVTGFSWPKTKRISWWKCFRVFSGMLKRKCAHLNTPNFLSILSALPQYEES